MHHVVGRSAETFDAKPALVEKTTTKRGKENEEKSGGRRGIRDG